ncbi:MAG: hypothetical protein R3C68_10525 [Myxococcota bacterium]
MLACCRFVLASVVVLVGLGFTVNVFAARVVVDIEGKSANKIRQRILKALPKKTTVARSSTFDKPPISKSRKKLAQRVRQAGKKVDAKTIIIGQLKKAPKGKQRLWLFAVDVTSGTIVQDTKILLAYSKGTKKKKSRLDYAPLTNALKPVLRSIKKKSIPPSTQLAQVTTEPTPLAHNDDNQAQENPLALKPNPKTTATDSAEPPTTSSQGRRISNKTLCSPKNGTR